MFMNTKLVINRWWKNDKTDNFDGQYYDLTHFIGTGKPELSKFAK